MQRSLLAGWPAVLAFVVVTACSGGSNSTQVSGTGDGNESGNGDETASSSSGGTKPGASSSGASGSSSGNVDPNNPACPNGTKTTLSGTVYDPANVNPLPHVVVYVPKGPLPAIPQSVSAGITCETCADVQVDAIAKTITDSSGKFTLEDVPVGKSVSVVVQVGKWRREVKVEVENACAENEVDDHKLRLPKKGSEGSMPHIAVTTGACDAMECMLRGMGIDDSEFVVGASTSGHVHIFKGSGGKLGSDATTLWNDAESLKQYDAVVLSCECDEYEDNKGGIAAGARASMYDYLNAGGRVFATHYQSVWFSKSPQSEFTQLASWQDGFSTDGEFDVDTSFPKGAALSEWLHEVGASSVPGKLPLKAVRGSVSQLNAPAHGWISKPTEAPKVFSVNTPISAASANQCGRAVFSDFHVTDTSGPSYIGGCALSAGGLTPQQKAIEYFLLDLTSCVQDDSTAPSVPGP